MHIVKFMKFIGSIVLLSTLLGASSTSQKISASKKELNSVQTKEKKTIKQLDKVAKEIKVVEKEIVQLSKKITKLSEEEKRSQKRQKKFERELVEAQKVHKKYTKRLKEKNQVYAKLLTEQFSIILALEEMGAPTQESMLSKEVYVALKAYNGEKLLKFKQEIKKLKREENAKERKCNEIETALKHMKKKRKRYIAKKEKKEKLVTKLHQSEDKYQKQLQNIVDAQSELRKTLAALNILQKKEVEKAKRAAEARKEAIRLEKEHARKVRALKLAAQQKALKKRVAAQKAEELVKQAKTKKAKEDAKRLAQKAKEEAKKAAKEEKVALTKVYTKSEKIRKIHSSYKKANTFAYRGKKTISPLTGAKVVKKFGTYVDPIYNIKVFNEGIVLRAPRRNAKVHNVLNGTVVFSGSSSMLGNVVVIAHSKKLHTVYAGLASIAPNIKKGRRLKKGYSVGKVNKKLVFQATKNSKHINPERLIRI